MNNSNIEKRVIIQGRYEDVVQIKDHFYIIFKKNRVAVLPYTISSEGLLDKVGVIRDYNYILEKYDYTILSGYISLDDATNLVAANRILQDRINLNITNANKWMYLGGLYNNLTSDSAIHLYCVNLTDENIIQDIENQQNNNFNMIDSSYVITSDDSLLLSSFFRLFNYFYVNSLNNRK